VAGSHQSVRLPQLATYCLRWPSPAFQEDPNTNSIAPISSYISYRQSFTHHPAKKPRFGASNGFDAPSQPEESRRLISETGGFEEDGDMVIEMDLLPPRWVDVQDEVSELLADIAQKSAELDKLHQKHLLPGFGDEDLRRQDEGVIERLTQDITRGFHSCQNAIKRIDMMVREAKLQGGVTSGEETMAKNIQISLASRVQESSARFRKKQSTYLKSESSFAVFGSSPVELTCPCGGWAHRTSS
jgi:syntaxin 16